ncbi:hypothetical protein DKX38_004794 [Salix brachista]|uniref:Uncharacterized protein n=1 Tax=Salix brachista TaxID=2182728 RepID=A0A5N5NAT7_9ROSI|nr:hypothetical protein DKX38_004794 [Salix brachista]
MQTTTCFVMVMSLTYQYHALTQAHRESSGTVTSSDVDIEDPVAAAEEIAFCRACARFGLGLYLLYLMPAVTTDVYLQYSQVWPGLLLWKRRIPAWWRWHARVNPVAWTLHGLVASQLGDMKKSLETGETVEEYSA